MRRAATALLPIVLLLASGCRDEGDGTPPDLRRRIDSLQLVVERLRGARFLAPVQGRTVPRSRLLDVYDSAAFETLDPADTAWDELLWAFGFVDSLDENDSAADSVDRASIGAFYAGGVLWVVDDVTDSGGELDVTIAHELVHALQDQRWNLGRTEKAADGLDARLALQYLVEGEARLVETMCALGSRDSLRASLPDLPLDAYRDSLRVVGGLDPELVTIPVFHPYEQGAHVLERRLDAGGWEAIDRWWRNPPRTTACFLHQGASCFLPRPLPLAPLLVLPPGWRRIHRGRLGLVYANILFSLWSSSSDWIPPGELRSGWLLGAGRDLPPDSVVQGMLSDSFALFADDSGALSLAWRTEWRDEDAAARFLESWGRLLVRKQRSDEVVARAPNTLLLARDAMSGVWDRAERFGREVWIVEGVPGREPVVFEGGARRSNGASAAGPRTRLVERGVQAGAAR